MPITSHLYFVYTVLFIVQVLFGVNFVASKIIVGNLEPTAWAFYRFLISGILLLTFTNLIFKQRPHYSFNYFLKINLFAFIGFTVGQLGMLKGLKLTTSINTSIITSTIPIWTMTFVLINKSENMGLRKVLGFLISFTGVLVIRDFTSFQFSNETFIGDGLVLIGAIASGTFIGLCRPFLLKNNHFYASSWMFLFGALQIGILALLTGTSFEIKSYSTEMVSSMVYSALFATLLTYFLSNWALTKVQSGNVAFFIYFQPVVAAILAWSYLDEVITLRTFLSTGLIILGFLVVCFPFRKMKQEEDQRKDHT
ncbi:MAG: DMT family transporter [Bacteriovoracaceae bacterium]